MKIHLLPGNNLSLHVSSLSLLLPPPTILFSLPSLVLLFIHLEFCSDLEDSLGLERAPGGVKTVGFPLCLQN